MVGHCSDTLRLDTAGILCGWALQGYCAVGHCRDMLPLSIALKLREEGEDNIDFKIASGRAMKLQFDPTFHGSRRRPSNPCCERRL